MVVTGGALIHAKHTEEIAKYALFDESNPASLRPENAEILVDVYKRQELMCTR